MEHEGLLPRLQKHAIGPYSQPDASSPHSHPIFLRSILISSSHLYLGLPSGLFPLGFPTKILYAFLFCLMCATCPSHVILIIFGEVLKL
jgi:hypothetical protein